MKLVAATLPNVTWVAPPRQVPLIKTLTISIFGLPIGDTCLTVGGHGPVVDVTVTVSRRSPHTVETGELCPSPL